MMVSAGLRLRQSHSPVITPQLVQAIRLLQMPAQDLAAYLASEMEQNPFLAANGDVEGESEHPQSIPDHSLKQPGARAAANSRSSVQVPMHPPRSGGGRPAGERAIWAGEPLAELEVPASESLEEMLERRIGASFIDPAERRVALGLLAHLDAAGYVTITLEELAVRIDVGLELVEAVLARCQELAPSGVFARSLAECLALQLADGGRLDRRMEVLLDNLEGLAGAERSMLCRLCGVHAGELDRMIGVIRSLDPKPGLAFDREPVRTNVPDVLVQRHADGSWVVELNDAALPRVLVDRSYHAVVSERCDEDERKYIAECLQKATWLERSLDQRARTILRVAAEIVRRQRDFLDHGVTHLRPLNLRTVGDALGLHESTVSRAAASKTIATPRGVFEFRFFFSGSLPDSRGGDMHSAEAVKHRIRQMIGSESPEGSLSDDAIVSMLSRQGVEIARRTVAKYRELMRIGSSPERRRSRRMKAAS
jgi:RNA polymerase sigma-54 factor